ncbi:hypothetical protein FPOA_13870 [Fusarium poae]|uniref:BED-type domain-containing protein n=1 Tax=Fusarium poae TaxID=36050 RepID=A0A1B8A476_FUSPO|nr:hypothetical protein FPOA_13870 [Fusarium poae]
MHDSSSRSSRSIIKDWDAVSQAVRSHWVLSARTGQATGWFWAHGYDVQARSKGNESGPHTWLCCHCVQHGVPRPKAYVSSNTRNIEGHLSKAHNIFHPDPSKATRYMQERPPNQLTLHDLAAKKRKRDDFHDELVTRFDKTTFQRHIVQWITDANLSFRVPENKGLQKVFQYLNPLVHETSANLTHETVRVRIIDEFNTYKSRVIHALSRSPSQVHIAFDGWTSRNRHSFFSINAFFLDEDTFQPRTGLKATPPNPRSGSTRGFHCPLHWQNPSGLANPPNPLGDVVDGLGGFGWIRSGVVKGAHVFGRMPLTEADVPHNFCNIATLCQKHHKTSEQRNFRIHII